MAIITVSGSASVTKDGVTSTLSGTFAADVDRLIEVSRDLTTSPSAIITTAGGLAFAFIANKGDTYIEWSVIPTGGATLPLSGAVPPGGHALIPSYIFTDAGGATSGITLKTASGIGSAYVLYGIKPA
jgi:hypothetical protein